MNCRFRLGGPQKGDQLISKRGPVHPRQGEGGPPGPLFPLPLPGDKRDQGDQLGPRLLPGTCRGARKVVPFCKIKKGTTSTRKIALGVERRCEILELKSQPLERFGKSAMACEMLRGPATNNFTK
jgi:hypothetical protein